MTMLFQPLFYFGFLGYLLISHSLTRENVFPGLIAQRFGYE